MLQNGYSEVSSQIDLRLSPSLPAASVYLRPHKAWLRQILECELEQAAVLRLPVPYGDFILEEFLKTPLALSDGDVGADCSDDETDEAWTVDPFGMRVPLSLSPATATACVSDMKFWRSMVVRWEQAPREPVELDVEPIRRRSGEASSDGWSTRWRGPAFAVWCKGLQRPLVFIRIQFVAFQPGGGPSDDADVCVVINSDERAEVFRILRSAFMAAPNVVRVIGGRNVRLADQPYDWDQLVLPSAVLDVVRNDFETFLGGGRSWFIENRVPYKRGYLFWGPPGNGKTSIIRIMAARRDIRSFSIDFSNEQLGNGALTLLFELASRNQPSLVILEDLDRLYPLGTSRVEENRTGITLQHLFNALDGVGSRDGVIVVATANDVSALPPALAQRRGRFDHVVHVGPPDIVLRAKYLSRLKVSPALSETELNALAKLSEGFCFADLTTMHSSAAQAAFARQPGSRCIRYEDLERAVEQLHAEMERVKGGGRFDTGFRSSDKDGRGRHGR
jgi:hypothetical protein